jgi:hypothetical protein
VEGKFPEPPHGLRHLAELPGRFIGKTTDGGLTWQELPLVANGCKEFGVGFANDSTGWIGTDTGNGYETLHGGQTWQTSSLGRYINKVRLVRDSAGRVTAGYAIGLNLTKLQITTAPTAVTPDAPTPVKSTQLVATPNPATRQLTLRYYLARQQRVTLLLTDAAGRTLATVLANAQQAAGDHTEAYTLPKNLPNNLLWFTLQTEDGRDSTAVSVQP